MPATVGGSTIGARTNGRMALVNLFELLANTHASGTPKPNEITAAIVEVQRESLIAVKSERDERKLLQGTFVSNENKGAIMTIIAIPASAFVATPNFIYFRNLYSVKI